MTFSSKRRAPAIKLKIKDITEGEFETIQDGSKVLHVKTDDLVRRVRIMGKITGKTVIESDESIILEVEDTSGSLKVKGGGSEWAGQVFLAMRDLKEGSFVDIVGLIREAADGKAYIDCELCLPVIDDAVKVLRELEISKYYKRKGLDSKATDGIESAIKDQVKLTESDKIKTQILELLKKAEHLEEGCTFDEIKRSLGLTTKELEPELRDLQNDGDIFEPMPGTFKYV